MSMADLPIGIYPFWQNLSIIAFKKN